MVKRAKSPELVEEARYYTVCQPFPLNANLIFDKDQKACATWIAECIGLEHLYAMHYKPSASGMILIEVSKMFTDHERLLGEHRWSEILTKPGAEEKKRVSQVFHSFYATGREAQKDGWKNLVVQSTWFKNWSPGTGRFKQPYPQTHWCPIPVEDKTNKQLCRPIPVEKIAPPPARVRQPVVGIAPPPARVKQPVVGSATWTQTKNTDKPTAETLTKAWDEDVASIDLVSKLIEPVQPKPNAGSSVPVVIGESPPTTSTASPYPPLARIATSVPNKSQPSSNNASPRNNKKKKFVPLNQVIDKGGNNKSSSPAWNKPAATTQSASSPATRSPLNGSSPKPTPSPANALGDKPIQLPAPSVPVAPVKKETAPEDLASWGQESATFTVDQDNIWNSPLPNKKKRSKKGKKGHPGAIPETTASSTSPASSTQPSSPQIPNNIPPSISSTARNVLPYPTFRPLAESEEENSDDEGIYKALSKMKFTDVDDANDVEHIISDGVKEDRMYGNLWLSEEDPRAIPLPELLCPTHHIACQKGICTDMGKMLWAIKRKELEAKWEEEKKKKKNKGRRKKESDEDSSASASNTGEVDGDKFAVAGPQGKRKGFGRQKKAQDTPEVEEPSYTGRMRAFSPDNADSDDVADAANDAQPETEGQIFSEW
ncbi:hypothetical protein BYT27DRAFT_7192653 [Phlegmacium glaucopus]|nr:hypothetical protein BYT27DRAFT_7192653 [Phlegmacium glaucopus]